MRLGNNQIDYQYKMCENNLEETISEKDLGVYIDNKLRLSDHVDAAVNKANRLVGLIRRSYEHLDGDSLVQLYKAYSKTTSRIWACNLAALLQNRLK